MRCPDCNKFVSLSADSDPEVGNLEINTDGKITGAVRVVLTCADCGAELKEANFEVESQIDAGVLAGHTGDAGDDAPKHELSVESDGGSITEEMPLGKNGKAKTSGPANIGFSLSADVMCSCQKEALISIDIADSLPASELDELV